MQGRKPKVTIKSILVQEIKKSLRNKLKLKKKTVYFKGLNITILPLRCKNTNINEDNFFDSKPSYFKNCILIEDIKQNKVNKSSRNL